MFPWLLPTLAMPHTYRFYSTLLSRCQPCTPTLLSLQLSFVLYSLLFRYVFKPSTYHLASHLDLFVVGTRYVLSFVLDTNINFVIGTSICLCLSQLPLPLCVNALPSCASLWQGHSYVPIERRHTRYRYLESTTGHHRIRTRNDTIWMITEGYYWDLNSPELIEDFGTIVANRLIRIHPPQWHQRKIPTHLEIDLRYIIIMKITNILQRELRLNRIQDFELKTLPSNKWYEGLRLEGLRWRIERPSTEVTKWTIGSFWFKLPQRDKNEPLNQKGRNHETKPK